MRFGVALGRVNPGLWTRITEVADHLGFDFISMPEHLVLPVQMSGSPTGSDHPPIDSSLPVYDVWVYFAFLAARTCRIRFGTYVYNLGLRHPFTTARAVATLDILSKGRVDVGLGASWLAEEWDATGLDFRTRGRRFDETIDICRRLWTEPVVEHHGEFFDFQPVRFDPKPIQQPVPLLLGGDAEITRRRAARLGAAWVPLRTPVPELPAAINHFRSCWQAAGRQPASVRVVRAVRQVTQQEITSFADIGITDLVVAPWRRSRDAIDALHGFSEQHISAPRHVTP